MFFLAAMAVRESHSCAIENGTDSFFYSFGPLVLSISKKKAAPMYILSSWLTSLFCHILRSIQVIFVERRDLPLFTSPHSSRFVMLNTNSWVIEESFFNIRLISASRIGLCRIMQLLSSQVVFIYMQNKTKQKKQVFCFVLFSPNLKVRDEEASCRCADWEHLIYSISVLCALLTLLQLGKYPSPKSLKPCWITATVVSWGVTCFSCNMLRETVLHDSNCRL